VYTEVVVTEYNEEEDIDARIWHSLVRKVDKSIGQSTASTEE
jgi:hypothetical protein